MDRIVFEQEFEVIDKSSVRLLKNVVIAKSGIYSYLRRELGGFSGLNDIPPQHSGRMVFNVYRPPEVIDSAKDLFARQPMTVEHPSEFINGDNFRQYTVGWVGDSAETISTKDDSGEVAIKSTLMLVDNQGIDYYNRGVREVSPGYKAIFSWQDGVTDSGDPFQIVMKEIIEVNHLALVKSGRGGKESSIIDSIDSSRSEEMTEEDKKSLLDGFVSAISGIFKGKEIIDSKPEEITLDSLPKDPKDFTIDHTNFLLGMVRDSMVQVKKEIEDSEPVKKDSESGPEKPEEEAVDEKPKDSGFKEKASVEGEELKTEDSKPEELVKDSSSVFTASVSSGGKSGGFDLKAFDDQISGKNKGGK